MRGVMASGRRRWATVATLLLLVHALGIAGRLAWKEGRRIGRTDHDGPADAARRARSRALASALPPTGVFGFIGAPRPTTGAAHFDALQHPELQQLQYELAPRLFVEGAGAAQVVVSLDGAAGAYAAAAAHGLRVVHDLGGGLVVATPSTPTLAPGRAPAGAR